MKLKRVTTCILAGAIAVSTLLTGCGNSIKADAVGATLDGKEISLGFMNFMARFQQATYDGYMLAYFGDGMWSSETEGKTMEESTKEQIAESVETMYLLESHMADYKVEVTDEDTKAIETATEKFMSDNSKKALKQVGATEEYVNEMLRLYTIESRMRQAIYKTVDTKVTDDEAAQKTFSYVKVDANGKNDENGSYKEFTAEEKTALKETVTKLAEDAKKDFDNAIKDAGYEVATKSYGEDDLSTDKKDEEDSQSQSDFDIDVLKAADAMKKGDISKLITKDDAYYVVRLDSEFDKDATETKKKSIVSDRQSAKYKEICDGYKEKAKFELNEDEWNKVKFDALFNVTTSKKDTSKDQNANNNEGTVTPDDASGDSGQGE